MLLATNSLFPWDCVHTWKQTSRTALSWLYFSRWLFKTQSYNLTEQSQEETRRNGDELELNITAVIPSSGKDFNLISLESAISTFPSVIDPEIVSF